MIPAGARLSFSVMLKASFKYAAAAIILIIIAASFLLAGHSHRDAARCVLCNLSTAFGVTAPTIALDGEGPAQGATLPDPAAVVSTGFRPSLPVRAPPSV